MFIPERQAMRMHRRYQLSQYNCCAKCCVAQMLDTVVLNRPMTIFRIETKVPTKLCNQIDDDTELKNSTGCIV